MPLAPGTRVGPYAIVGPLGAGGMGEVFRAHDTRLARDVAIKALPEAVARDPESLVRLEREARVLASLQHPNIATIYGLEEAGGSPCLVLELVEGESLAQRLVRGPLTLRECLEIGARVASAIEAAHAGGIVHRDLKPANVMLARGGAVKVLDFGLARDDAAAGEGAADAPTRSPAATVPGMLLGTSAYMSPEQARGSVADRRADVWAFGCLLFEGLAGHRAFGGGTVSEVLARVLEREPEWSALPPGTPPRLRDLVRRCLTKDVGQRPRDIGDLRRELESIAQDLSGMPRRAPDVPSVAVLYFENLAENAVNDWFCAGITEDILTDLSKIRALRVASRNAVARYRGAPADIPRVAAEIGVGAVLEGSVRRDGGRVRITAQLLHADGFHLWAERYDRTLEDVFAVQAEIAAAITGALRVALAPDEAAAIGRDRPDDIEAYDLYLQGRACYGQYSIESIRQAMGLFERATAIDPDYARAWAGIADCCGQLIQWGAEPPRGDLSRRGLEAARRAIALDPRLPEAYKAESLVLRFTGDRDGARAALLKALDADPRFVPALQNLGVDEFCQGNLASAERRLRRALDIDPQGLFSRIWLTVICLGTHRIDEALGHARSLRGDSKNVMNVTAAHLLEIEIRLRVGDLEAAEATAREAVAAGARPDQLRAFEVLLAARRGRLAEARAMLREMEEVPGLVAGPVLALALTAIATGQPEVAVRVLGRPAVDETAPMHIRLDPELHALLDAPPFAPRRMDATLVWPLEAPPIDRARFRLFREVRIESGLPDE
jgi:serine/threonine protein kinase/tetratricopeptide (TPR) repeat protein